MLVYQNKLFLNIWCYPVRSNQPNISEEYDAIYYSLKKYLSENHINILQSLSITDIISLEAAIKYISKF